MGVNEKRREYRVVLDGMRTYVVARSVTFYEQSLVDAMRTDIGMELSDSIILDVGASPKGSEKEIGEASHSQFSSKGISLEAQSKNSSLTDAFKLQQFSEIDGRMSLVASKSSLLSPASTKPKADPFPTPKHDGK